MLNHHLSLRRFGFWQTVCRPFGHTCQVYWSIITGAGSSSSFQTKKFGKNKKTYSARAMMPYIKRDGVQYIKAKHIANSYNNLLLIARNLVPASRHWSALKVLAAADYAPAKWIRKFGFLPKLLSFAGKCLHYLERSELLDFAGEEKRLSATRFNMRAGSLSLLPNKGALETHRVLLEFKKVPEVKTNRKRDAGRQGEPGPKAQRSLMRAGEDHERNIQS